jgi:hypothetical protein
VADFWEGAGEFTAKLREYRENERKGAARGLSLAALLTLRRSNRKVPHEEGDLERDGAASVDEEKLRAAVSYGRSAHTRDYAIPQHERMDYHHDAGRSAKFLELAMAETARDGGELIAGEIRKETGA